MRIAILSDAHGNLNYFNEVFKAVIKEKPDKIIYLGDAFGYMPGGVYVLNKLLEIDAIILKGNHEAMLVGDMEVEVDKDRIYSINEERLKLSNAQLAFVSNLKPFYELEVEGRRCLFVHGSPLEPLTGYLYQDDKDYKWNDDYDYIFMGHTHRPFIKRGDRSLYVNVGSCGLPRDKGNMPSYAIFDSITDECNIRRITINEEILEETFYRNIHGSVKNVLMRRI